MVPFLAHALDASLAKSAGTERGEYLSVFDLDNDGTIADGDVACSALFKEFLAGDVDLDRDGDRELSIGLVFTAVDAVFNP